MKSVKLYLLGISCALLSLCSPAWAATNLPFGQVVTGAVTAESSIALPTKYSFSANTGDVVNFTLVATSGSLVPEIQLYNSTGTLIASNNAGYPFGCSGTVVQMNTVQLPASSNGTYAVWVTDCNGSNGGNYSLYAQRTNSPGGTVVPLPFGSEEAGSIGAVSQSNTYTFSANANDMVDVTLDTTSGALVPAIQVYNPNGTLLSSNTAGAPFGCSGTNVELNTVQIPISGNYTVLINDCSQVNAGGYEIYAQRTDAPGPPIVSLLFDQVQTGTIGTETQNNTYTFSANANDVVNFTLDTTSGSLIPAIRLYNPNGTLLSSTNAGFPFGCSGTNLTMNTVSLPLTGTYTVLIADCNTTNSGSYAIFSQRTNNPTSALNLPFGQTQTGLIGSVTQSNPYTFKANANDVVDFTLDTTNGDLIPAIQLYNPNGSLLSSTNSGFPFGCSGTTLEMNTITIPTTGTYTVLVLDCNTTNTGNYALYAQRTNSPAGASALLWSQVQTGTIGAVAQSSTFTFAGTASDVIDLTMKGTSSGGSLVPKIRLYNPDGSLLSSNNSGYPFGCSGNTTELSSVQLGQTGNYTVLLGDCNDTNTGNFSLSGQCSGTCLLPAPALASISPTSALAGGGSFTLTVNGTNFVNEAANSVVQWNGTPLQTTWVSTTQMTAVVPAAVIATFGTASVTVFTPSPGGGTSAAQTFTMDNPVPALSLLSPASATAGSAAFTLTLTGSNFVPSSEVQWNGTSLAITSQSATMLKATVPASDCTVGGTATIAVLNLAPGGGHSNALTFTCNNPAPAPVSLVPASAEAGGSTFTLTVMGSSFVGTSTVNWNGSPLATTYVSATELTATVPAADIATPGAGQVTVTNLTPGGGTSPILTLPIEVSQAAMISPTPGTQLPGPSVTFSWNAAYDATGYYLWIGSTGAGSNNIYNSALKTATTYTFTNMPLNGETIYVRLITNTNGNWRSNDYTYTAATEAGMTAPVSGSALSGPTAAFTWTAATGSFTGYYLWIGTTGAGSNNIYNSALKTVTSYTFTGIPTNGETVYVRLITNFNGVWEHADYTYIAATQAALTSPASGSQLSGKSVTFDWTSVGSATNYYLLIGSLGAGSNDIYNSAPKTVTSYTFSNMPTNGETIYVRLTTNFSGVWLSRDYTFKAATPPAPLTAPASGSVLSGPSATFTWTAAPGATGYYLWIGSTGAGSNDIYNSEEKTVTTYTFTHIPTNGEPIYVRLITNYNGTWVSLDYTFTAAPS